jgi:hypothetical protein
MPVDCAKKISKYEYVKNFPSMKTEIFPSLRQNTAARSIQNSGADAAAGAARVPGRFWFKTPLVRGPCAGGPCWKIF